MISATEPTNVDKPKNNGQPPGRSTKWDIIQHCPFSSQLCSYSPPPPLGSAVPAPRTAVIITRSRSTSPNPSIGYAEQSQNRSFAANKKQVVSTEHPHPTSLPTPCGHPIATHPIIRPQRKRSWPSALLQYGDIYNRYVVIVISFVGLSMLHTGWSPIKWAREHNTVLASFKRSEMQRTFRRSIATAGNSTIIDA